MRCLLRPTRLLRQPLTAPSLSARAVTVSLPRRRSFTRTYASESTAGYGDPDQTGDDPSNKPNLQGSRPRIDTEHPGREPIDEGKGTGSGGYAETGEKAGGGRGGTGGEGKSELIAPRLGKDQGGLGEQKGDMEGGGLGGRPVSEMQKPMPNEGEKEEVDKHNREMDQRYDHTTAGKEDEKVEKDFWTGHGGRDRDP